MVLLRTDHRKVPKPPFETFIVVYSVFQKSLQCLIIVQNYNETASKGEIEVERLKEFVCVKCTPMIFELQL